MPAFTVEKMTCGYCVNMITRAVQDIDPEAHVTADTAIGSVDIDSGASRDQLAAVIEKAGYPVIDRDEPEAR